MPGRDWVLLVTGTMLGIVSLTADLVHLGGFPGFGWKQILGTVVAIVLVGYSGWRIYHGPRWKRL